MTQIYLGDQVIVKPWTTSDELGTPPSYRAVVVDLTVPHMVEVKPTEKSRQHLPLLQETENVLWSQLTKNEDNLEILG